MFNSPHFLLQAGINRAQLDAAVAGGIGDLTVGIAGAGQVVYTASDETLKTEAGFEYNDTLNILTVPSLLDTTLTASRLVASAADKQLASVSNLQSWIAGTANQVNTADDGDGSITLSLPQNIHTGASPTFAAVTATTFNGALNGNASTATLAATATVLATPRTIGGVSFDGSANIVPQTIQIIDAASDTTTFPLLASSATGSLQPVTDAGLSYNASTNVLTTTTFAGALTGNATTATSAATLTTPRLIGGVSFNGSADIVPTTIVVADTADTTCFVGLWESATGNLLPKTDAGITYNASTATLTVTNISGTVATATVANTVVVADAASDTTTFPVLAGSATGNLPMLTDAGLSYNASTNTLTVAGSVTSPSITLSGLTNGRVPFVSTGGLLADDDGFLYSPSINTLFVTNGQIVNTAEDTFGLSLTLRGRAADNRALVLFRDNIGSAEYTRFSSTDTFFTIATNSGGSILTQYNLSTLAAIFGGDVHVNGGDLLTSQTTFNLINATATTLNIGGAATTGMSVGNTSGTNRYVGRYLFADSPASPTGSPRFYFGSGGVTALFGADSNLLTLTDATDKFARIGTPHYTNAEEAMALMVASSGVAANTVNIGGGTALFNAATQINFLTAANNTTVTGTTRMSINSAGTVTITSADINGGAIDGTTIGASSASTGAFTTVSATTFTGALVGNASTATLASTVTVADAAADTTMFPMLAGSATGSLPVLTDAGLSYNASTNALTATTFIGALTGNASTATTLATPRTIGNVSFNGSANIVPETITVIDSTDATSFIAMFDSATGSLQPKTDAGLTYSATTGILTATGLVGPHNGTLGATTPAAATVTTLVVNTSCNPDAIDGAPLGSTTAQWSDLFLAEGGVINWDNGDLTLTQAGNTLTLAGGDLSVSGAITATAGNIIINRSNSGGDNDVSSYNSSDTASSGSRLITSVAGSSAGNPQVILTVQGSRVWSWTVENAASDNLYLYDNGVPVMICTSTGIQIDVPLSIEADSAANSIYLRGRASDNIAVIRGLTNDASTIQGQLLFTTNDTVLYYGSAPTEGFRINSSGITLPSGDINLPNSSAKILFILKGANLQSTSDQVFTKRGTFTNYKIDTIVARATLNAGGSGAAGGIYTGASKTGTQLVASGQSWSGFGAVGTLVAPTLAAVNQTDSQTATPILSLTTGDTLQLTADIYVFGFVLD